jgi:hypothetical protein
MQTTECLMQNLFSLILRDLKHLLLGMVNNYEQINLKDILMSYAYDPTNKSYDFLTILKELKK